MVQHLQEGLFCVLEVSVLLRGLSLASSVPWYLSCACAMCMVRIPWLREQELSLQRPLEGLQHQPQQHHGRNKSSLRTGWGGNTEQRKAKAGKAEMKCSQSVLLMIPECSWSQGDLNRLKDLNTSEPWPWEQMSLFVGSGAGCGSGALGTHLSFQASVYTLAYQPFP